MPGCREKCKPKLDDTNAIFVAAVALQNKFPLSSKFSRNPGSMPKTQAHISSTSGKCMDGFLVEA